MLTRELIGRLPKAELHVHLDGSLRPETMIELARDAKVPLPAYEPEPLRRFMLVDDAANLEDYLHRFDITIPLLQTPEALERVAYEMVEDAARDNVRYLEVRYCPHLSQKRGMTLDAVLEAELRGLQRGEREFGVRRPGNQLLAPPLRSIGLGRAGPVLGRLSGSRCRGVRSGRGRERTSCG